MKQRIFTFGCSFTNWVWPTWANILLYQNDGINFGYGGAGLEHTLHSIIECDRKYNFTENDIVIVMYTTPIRWDLILGDNTLKWICMGQTITSDYIKYLDELYSIEGLIYKSLNNVLIIDNYLKNKNVKSYMTSINDIFIDFHNYFENVEIGDNLKELVSYVQSQIKLDMTNMHSFLLGNHKKWTTNKIWTDLSDYHPTTLSHYKWMMNNFPEELKSLIKADEETIKQIENDIKNFVGTLGEGADYLKKKYKDFYVNQTDGYCYVNDFKKNYFNVKEI